MITKRYFTMTELMVLILIAIIIGAIAIPMLRQRPRRHHRRSCLNNLKQIGLSIKMYSPDFDDKFPDKDGAAGFEILRSNGYLEDTKIYACVNTSKRRAKVGETLIEPTVGFVYKGGLTETTDPNFKVSWDKKYNHDKFGNILFVDGHVKGYGGNTWSENPDWE